MLYYIMLFYYIYAPFLPNICLFLLLLWKDFFKELFSSLLQVLFCDLLMFFVTFSTETRCLIDLCSLSPLWIGSAVLIHKCDFCKETILLFPMMIKCCPHCIWFSHYILWENISGMIETPKGSAMMWTAVDNLRNA